jgi:8-oxo-dGTP pyrophosphatase MutT (NUDIX family)
MFDLEEISSALARQSCGIANSPGANERAAVALILAGPADDLNICLIRRASFKTDVWSGHVALPGGRAQPGETSAAQIVEREVYEEVRLHLGETQRRGSLPDVAIRLAGRERGLTLSSVVYFINKDLPPLQPGEEAAEAFWVPLSHLWNVGNATSLTLRDHGDVMAYPAIRIGSHFVWGVTLRVLTLFSDFIGHPLPHFEEIPGLRVL